jgi:X-X-X-Leu-X-X-Gly heptad repeat protein
VSAPCVTCGSNADTDAGGWNAAWTEVTDGATEVTDGATEVTDGATGATDAERWSVGTRGESATVLGGRETGPVRLVRRRTECPRRAMVRRPLAGAFFALGPR